MLRKSILVATALATTALALPVEERQACSGTWGQCGGIGYTGPTCCQSGSGCTELNPYYFQCLPGAAPGPTSTSTTSTSTRTSSSSSSTSTSSSSSPGGPVTTTTTAPPASGTGTDSYSGNPFLGVNMWANSYYKSEVSELAMPSLTPELRTKAAKVADVPSFMWMDTRAKVPLVGEELARIRAANQAGANPPNAGLFVVYLPDRDCAAKASNGELHIADGGVAKYKAYIDSIRDLLVEYADTRIILVIGTPDSLANMVTNMNVQKCQGAEAAYLECTDYAVRQLNLPNVAMYMDAGHAGWLGWPANIDPAAKLFADVFINAGKPKALRGLATNVSNYNGWNLTFVPSYTTPNPNYDEKHFVEAFAPKLRAAGWEDVHFITDQGRSGMQPTPQTAWGNWCNIPSGFGMRPSSNTGLDVQDAFVWIKPPGECDGTSDQSAVRYDSTCGLADAMKPAPEAGQWFQAYFEHCLVNANPPF